MGNKRNTITTSVLRCGSFSFSGVCPFTPLRSTRQDNGDLEDLWDFGTVRHGGRPGTIGRNQNSVRVSGPPLTWENNDSPSYGREHSQSPTRVNSSTYSASVTVKGELPPLPSPGASRFEQSTVRHAPLPAEKSPVIEQHAEAYEDYDDQFVDTYSSAKGSVIQQKMQDMHLEDDLPDTTMLDSVVLPAIASVSDRVVDIH